MSMQMIPQSLKEVICRCLANVESFKTLDELKRTSKSWCYTILVLQWEKYSAQEGPAWFHSDDSDQSQNHNEVEKHHLAFFEYGHYLTKHIEMISIHRHLDDIFLRAKCPNLNSLHIETYELNKVYLQKFMKLTPSITELSISYHGSKNVSFGSDYIISLNLQRLVKISLYGVTLKVFNLSFILDRCPNLKEIDAFNIGLYDMSDILVSENSNQLPEEHKQYPNIKSFEFGEIRVQKTEWFENLQDGVTLGMLKLFPNLVTLKFNGRSIEPHSSRQEYISYYQFELPRFPLLQLLKIEVTDIGSRMAKDLSVNCPNIQVLSLRVITESKNKLVYGILRTIAGAFPRLIQFVFNLDTVGIREAKQGSRLLDALFFDQSDDTVNFLNQRRWRTDEEIKDLSFETPIKFSWPYLKEIFLGSLNYFSPQILLALSQFRNLEKLHIYLLRLPTINEIEQCIHLLNSTANQIIANESDIFPNIHELNIGFRPQYQCSTEQCIKFINMFPVMGRCKVNWKHEDKYMWEEAMKEFPNVVWKINHDKYY